MKVAETAKRTYHLQGPLERRKDGMTAKSGLQSRQQRHALFAQRGHIAANARKGLRSRTAAEAPGDLLLHAGPCADRAPPNCYQNPRGGLPGRAGTPAGVCAADPADCGRDFVYSARVCQAAPAHADATDLL